MEWTNPVLAQIFSGKNNPLPKPTSQQPKEEWDKYTGPWRGEQTEIKYEVSRALG